MVIKTERQSEDRVRQLVQNVKREMDITRAPPYEGVDHPVARHLGIVVVEERNVSDEGLYVPSNPPKIAIDTSFYYPDRRNFTFYHEVTHHLIAGDEELVEFLHELNPTDSDYKSALEEYCNIGAAEFLMPSEEIRYVFDERMFSIQLLPEFDQTYPASKPAIAIQMAQCATHQCVVVVCEKRQLPQQDTSLLPLRSGAFSSPVLHVSYASTSPTFEYGCGTGATIPGQHIIANAYEERAYLKGHDNIPFQGGSPWAVDCEVLYYEGKVYAAFNVTDPVSPLQMTFEFMDN